jgi:hypothetical protein
MDACWPIWGNNLRDSSTSADDDGCAHDSPVPMARSHGFHLPGRRILMALAAYPAYYDGSGKDDTRAISLSGVAAAEPEWASFDSAWKYALDAHGAQCFHMSDAINLRKRFARKNGWNEHKVDALIRDLVKIMSGYRNRGFQFRSCTVIRDDYARAKSEHPTLRPLHSICVNYCVGGLAVPRDHEVILYFDRNEAFLHKVNRVWEHLKNKPLSRPPWVDQARNIMKVDSGYYAIQAADCLSWSVNREQTHRDYQQWAISAKMLSEWKLYDYDAIIERYANDKWF